MGDIKVHIYTPAGLKLGYFLNPQVQSLPEGDYDLAGEFYNARGQMEGKLAVNPQAQPYTADLSEVKDVTHTKLVNVYVQHCRQPVRMSGKGA